MKIRTVINYTTGGLGNRLRPLSSAYAAAKESGRILCQYWDSKTTNGTLAKFNELFENDIKELSSEDLGNLKSYKIYSALRCINRLLSKYGRHELSHLVGNDTGSLSPRGSYTPNDSEDNIIFYCNNFIPNTNREFCHEFIKSLRPAQAIQEKIDKETVELGLDKNVIGVHARGTDFNAGVHYYIKQMHAYGGSAQFFLSTDDLEYEKEICSAFKDRVIMRQGRAHITKENEDEGWEYNFVISKEKSQDAVVDMYLLAETDIQIYHPGSTFCEIARILA